MRLSLSRSGWGQLAVLALVIAAAYPMQVNGWNQTAHYAATQAFARGTPTIDETRGRVGEVSTGDVSIYKGHVYSNKAPGLPFLSVPAFLVLDSAGMRTTGDPTRAIWALHLWSIVPAFALMLLLVRWAAERLEPGFGTAAAVTLGLGTLVLPFSTLFFAHVLSAALGFAAFALLWRERDGPPRLLLVGAAGLVAGLAVTTEYSLVLLAVILGVYALARGDLFRRGGAYSAGVLLGMLPLALYNLWAFGSIVHSPYEGNQTGELGGFYGAGTPSGRLLFDALFSAWGLLTLTPVLACGLAAAALVYRRHSRRAEALVVLGVVAVYLAWAACFRLGITIFGGLGPPRYLIVFLPFLAVPLGVAFRMFPLTTVTLALVSVFQMVVATATNPLAMYDGDWFKRLAAADFSQTAASIVGVTGWYTIVPFFLAAVAAVACAVLATGPVRVARRDLTVAAGALAVWALVALLARNPAGNDFDAGYVAGVSAFAVAAAALIAVARAARSGTWIPRSPSVRPNAR